MEPAVIVRAIRPLGWIQFGDPNATGVGLLDDGRIALTLGIACGVVLAWRALASAKPQSFKYEGDAVLCYAEDGRVQDAGLLLDLFEHSPYLSEQMMRHPDLLQELRTIRQRPGVDVSIEEARQLSEPNDLRRFFRREMFRIQAESICLAAEKAREGERRDRHRPADLVSLHPQHHEQRVRPTQSAMAYPGYVRLVLRRNDAPAHARAACRRFALLCREECTNRGLIVAECDASTEEGLDQSFELATACLADGFKLAVVARGRAYYRICVKARSIAARRRTTARIFPSEHEAAAWLMA